MDQRQQDTLIEQVLQHSDRVFQELLPAVPRELLELDLTMPQLKIVLLLLFNDSLRMSELASGLGVSLATATGVVDRLVERGIIQRESHPSDRRVVLCQLSAEGRELVSGLWQSARERTWDLLRAVHPEELPLITQALEALSQAGRAARFELQPDSDISQAV